MATRDLSAHGLRDLIDSNVTRLVALELGGGDGDIVNSSAIVMDGGFVPGSAKDIGAEGQNIQQPHPPITSDYDGNKDEVWLCVVSSPGAAGTENVTGLIKVREIR